MNSKKSGVQSSPTPVFFFFLFGSVFLLGDTYVDGWTDETIFMPTKVKGEGYCIGLYALHVATTMLSEVLCGIWMKELSSALYSAKFGLVKKESLVYTI